MMSRDNAERLFSDNLALAHFARHRYGGMFRGFGEVSPEDVSQICMAALWNAALRFDGSRGCLFSTFAMSHMLGDMKKAVRAELKQAGLRAVSIDADPAGCGVEHIPGLCDVAEEAGARADLDVFLSALPERTRRIAALRAAGVGQAEIGKAMGLSQAHVSRILKDVRQEYAGACGTGGGR